MLTESNENAAALPAPFDGAEEACAPFALDGRTPDAVAVPDSEAGGVEVVRHAAAEQLTLVPWGGGTAIAQGNRLRAARWAAVSTARLTEGFDYSPDDMVVTAPAGMTLAALQERLAAKRQFLPIDAPHPETATLGGIVATNVQGLWRPAFGTPRDRLLGVRVVLADGSAIKGGGKVVKNVAGYDLCKLFAGSWGTLGLITEVTFKTSPLPEAHTHLLFAAPSLRAAVEAALHVHAAHLQPAYLTVVLPSPVFGEGVGGGGLCVGLLGSAEAIAWQETEITRLLDAAGLQRTEQGPIEEELRHLVADSPAPVIARLTTRPSDLPALVESLERDVSRLVCHVPTGIVEAAFEADNTLPERVRRRLPADAHLVWPRVPAEWKAEMDLWGPTRGDFALMRGIKNTLDPNGLFSPGRFVGRL